MNQILVSEKLYVTPVMKKKKKFFKLEFILSVFLLCILSSYYIYAEYDRTKSEQESKSILGKMSFKEHNRTTLAEIDTGAVKTSQESIIVILNEALNDNEEINMNEVVIIEPEMPEPQIATTSTGIDYYNIGTVNIPSINVNYPILQYVNEEDIDKLLKISPCKFWGADPNQIGNLCIVGHNYRSSKFFSKVPTLDNGDIVEITDLSGKTIQYSVYDKYIVEPTDLDCTSQITNGQKEVTLITCTNDNKQRYIIKVREI